MEYDLNQLRDSVHFQRLVNGILVARFGEDARLTPLRGKDGGSDGETAADNPAMEFDWEAGPLGSNASLFESPRPGRYLFQAKYHRTGERRPSDLRQLVVREFETELKSNLLSRRDRDDVNFFFLVTNVTASRDSIGKVDAVRKRLLKRQRPLHADIWWGERISALLDLLPELWLAFPELFPGGVPPYTARVLQPAPTGLARTFRLATRAQYERDRVVNFRQVELAHQLLDVFVDLDLHSPPASRDLAGPARGRAAAPFHHRRVVEGRRHGSLRRHFFHTTALQLLIDDEVGVPRLLLEGGPGQGKSTLTQMAAQVYRQRLLGESTYVDRDPAWRGLSKPRFPFRLDLGGLAEWLSDHPKGALEEYMAESLAKDSGGVEVRVQDIHTFVERSPVLFLFDGLDEVGSDELRDLVLDTVMKTVDRFETDLSVDLRVVLTSRPPALAGRREKLEDFERAVLSPMDSARIDEYLERWLSAQIPSTDERDRIRVSFEARRSEGHVEALARNPMQLSVLLQLLYLKGEAFPDRRAELYQEYFKIVIDRDVEKSLELRRHRKLVERLHSFLGFYFHGAAELGGSGPSWSRREIVRLAGQWLDEESRPSGLAEQFFALGEERFGLIVAASGEGEDTTYGFEVQPIQEYFAAAYISELLPDRDANEIFQLLVHRSYWREVALFLAGLRRPNEKADLVARAKAADRDPRRGWEQNGRSIVLQLLREGVLQEPGHVLEDATAFVVDLLDMRNIGVQRTPEGLVETLGDLGEQYQLDSLRERIVTLAGSYSRSNDEYALSLIHRVAVRVLPPDDYRSLVLGYNGTAARSRALVRMAWPYESPGVLKSLAKTSDYWKDVPSRILAGYFWRAALRQGVVLDVEQPADIHLPLALEFATDDRLTGGAIIEIRGNSPLAIWRLQQNLQAMHPERLVEGNGPGSALAKSSAQAKNSLSDASNAELRYEGLSPETEASLRELVDASSRFMECLGGSEEETLVSLEAYLGAIKNRLEDPGLSAWMACRCALGVLQGLPSFTPLSRKPEALDGVVETLKEHYESDFDRFLFWYRFPFHRSPLGMPDRVRLRRGTAPVPLHQVVARFVDGRLSESEDERALHWVADIPLSAAVTKALVETSHSGLSQLLKFLAERRVVGLSRRIRLRVQDTQRVLKLCRRTGDDDVLRGAATVLLSATFAKIAEPLLVAKILAAAPAGRFVTQVLRTARESPQGGDRSEQEPERNLSHAVAKLVLSEPERYPSRVINQAASVEAERSAGPSAPLFKEHPKLLGPAGEAD